jgi:hypothetical protein
MANVKISGLPAASAVADANEFEINEAGTSKKVTGSQIASYIDAELAPLKSADIGSTVQAYDADTAKLDVAQTFTANQTFSNDIAVNGLTVGKGANALSTNTALGVSALASGSLSGTQNTGIGWGSLFSNTTGSPNTAVGYGSLFLNTTGNANTAIGTEALRSNTTASSNTAVGYQALYLTTGGNNTALGRESGDTLTTGSNNTLIGFNAQPSSATVSNEITLGDANVTTVRMGNGDVIYPASGGGAGTVQAWVNFNGTGTVAIRGSGNVSSITDDGAGRYTVNFTTALPDANYAVGGLCGKTSSNNNVIGLGGTPHNPEFLTTSCRL